VTRAVWVSAFLALVAAPAPAQRPHRPHRSGLWGEFGGGPGRLRVACSGCNSVVLSSGSTSYIRIGGTVSDHVLIGVEAFSLLDRGFGFVSGDSGSTENGTIALIVIWFPGRTGLFVKGGVGLAGGQFTLPSSPTTADTSNGLGTGMTFGAGWDWSISRRFAFTVNVAAYVTAVGDVVLPSRRVDDVIATMYQGSIGFSFR